MATMNPYAPPQAHVDDVEDGDVGTQPVKTWSAQGRVGRLRYLAHLMAAYLLVAVAGFVGGLLGGIARSETLGTVVVGAAVAVYLLFTVLKTIQRSHDMDWSGWTSLLALIPFVGLIWIFKGGSQGRNRFGAPPPPNGLGVKVLALLFPAIALVGIIAAISIPAYQGYAKKAQMQQNR